MLGRERPLDDEITARRLVERYLEEMGGENTGHTVTRCELVLIVRIAKKLVEARRAGQRDAKASAARSAARPATTARRVPARAPRPRQRVSKRVLRAVGEI